MRTFSMVTSAVHGNPDHIWIVRSEASDPNPPQGLFTILNRGLFDPVGYAKAERLNGKGRISSQRNKTERGQPRIPIIRKPGPRQPRQQPCTKVVIDNY